MLPAEFHFLRPLWLSALPILALLLYRHYRRRQSGGWNAVCDPELLAQLLEDDRSAKAGNAWPAVAGLLAILSLAGPAWERLPQPVYRDARALVIALDLSLSMNAADLAPSRLRQARFRIDDLLRRRPGAQTGLLVYGGHPFVITPITHDTETIRSQLHALQSDLMPVPGSRPAAALQRALEMLESGDFQTGDVLLVGDDAGGPEALRNARKLARRGFRVSVLGAGTPEGAPVPLQRGGFLTNRKGGYVNPRLHEASLRALAEAGSGRYRRLRPEADPQPLLAFLERGSAAAQGQSPAQAVQWQDAGPWLLWLLLPLTILAFRRGAWAAACCCLLLQWPAPAAAWEWPDLWLRADQQGTRALEAGHPREAAELFQEPAWRAAALYRAGEYQRAIDALGDRNDPQSHYLRGNAHAKLGQLQAAVESYRAVLRARPEHRDARHNLDLVERLLHEQEARQPPAGGQNETDPAGEQQQTAGQNSAEDGGEQQQTAGQNSAEDGGEQQQTAGQNSAEDGGERQQTAGQNSAEDGGERQQTAGQNSAEDDVAQRQAAAEDRSARLAESGTTNADDERHRALEARLQNIEEGSSSYLRNKFRRDYRALLEQGRRPDRDEKAW